MKPVLVILLLATSALAGCASNAGPVYAGSQGSTYDAISNPARTKGVVSYDPNAHVAPRGFGSSGGGVLARKVQ